MVRDLLDEGTGVLTSWLHDRKQLVEYSCPGRGGYSTISIPETALIVAVCRRGKYGEAGVAVILTHPRSLLQPILFRVLYDAEAVNPEIAQAYVSGDTDCVLECFGHLMQIDIRLSAFQRPCFQFELLPDSPTMTEAHILISLFSPRDVNENVFLIADVEYACRQVSSSYVSGLLALFMRRFTRLKPDLCQIQCWNTSCMLVC